MCSNNEGPEAGRQVESYVSAMNGTEDRMEYRTREQIESIGSIRESTELDVGMSRRERLARWATILEQQPGRLRSIEGVEFADSGARRADSSPLSVAFDDPTLRAAGLRGDSVADACEFFGLSRHDVHHIVCYCHHGQTISPAVAANCVRNAMRRTLRTGVAVAGASALAALGLALAVL
jgi:hypothetical protein